jgi:hypothetical protein
LCEGEGANEGGEQLADDTNAGVGIGNPEYSSVPEGKDEEDDESAEVDGFASPFLRGVRTGFDGFGVTVSIKCLIRGATAGAAASSAVLPVL